MHTLLFVDDETDNLDALERVFRKKYKILKANSGPKALELLENQTVSVIISDQRMPEMTGVEFLEASQKLAPHAIRILLTGYTDIDSVIQAINKGHVYRYITKPWDTRDLTLTVEQSIDKFNLESQLKITNDHLEKALTELKELDESKSRFMILINHELKTPLTTLLSFAELLEQSELDEDQKKYLSRIQKSSERLQEIINDSLELVTSELGKIQFNIQTVAVEKLVLDAIQKIHKLFPQKNLKFNKKIKSINLKVDSGILSNVLIRILKNSAQHGNSENPIEIQVLEENNNCKFIIQNSGKTVPPSLISKILKPFATNEDIMNHSKGMGLGLTICNSLLKNLGTELNIKSENNTFTAEFKIPSK